MKPTQIDIHRGIVEQCKTGDERAYFELYNLYYKAMYNICTRMLVNDEEAKDALQEAFISAFNSINSFKWQSTFGAWLKRIVINKCITLLNKNRLLIEELNEQVTQVIEETTQKVVLNPVAINNAVKELPKGCRVVFTLYMLEGYDHQEIAEILDVSESTSKSQYHRAKQLMREQLNEAVCKMN